MSRRAYVEIDLSYFDEAEILAEAARIGARRSSPLLDGPETPRETLTRLMSDLSRAIRHGEQDEALRLLADLAGEDRGLRDAVEIGARRR